MLNFTNWYKQTKGDIVFENYKEAVSHLNNNNTLFAKHYTYHDINDNENFIRIKVSHETCIMSDISVIPNESIKVEMMIDNEKIPITKDSMFIPFKAPYSTFHILVTFLDLSEKKISYLPEIEKGAAEKPRIQLRYTNELINTKLLDSLKCEEIVLNGIIYKHGSAKKL